MNNIKADLLIIGAGSGGLVLASGAAQLGTTVVLVEGDKMGGDCLNYGCVPSKALLAAANRAYQINSSDQFGIRTKIFDFDYAEVMAYVHKKIATIAPHDSQERFEKMGVNVIRHYAKFKDNKTVIAGQNEITARRTVIATGSRAKIPNIEGLDTVKYLTNETLFDLRKAPRHLAILGGGPIGVEMAQAHARLGIKTTLIEINRILQSYDTRFVEPVAKSLIDDGVRILQNTVVNRVEQGRANIKLYLSSRKTLLVSDLLVAAGRMPNIDRLSLSQTRIKYNERGVQVNKNLRTTSHSVYAIGDVVAGSKFTHTASYHAGIVLKQILLGLPSKLRTNHIPQVTYSDPEIASVGIGYDAAVKRFGHKVERSCVSLKTNDRAITDSKTKGFIEILTVGRKLVGCTIISKNAGELITFWAFIIARKLKISDINSVIPPYPTIGEVNKRVVSEYYGRKVFGSKLLKLYVGIIQKYF